MKRVFETIEIIFDMSYLASAFVIGVYLLVNTAGYDNRLLAGVMVLVLGIGDAFHLIPRILSILTQRKDHYRQSLGRGKQITSITITLFYLLLWQLGLSIYKLEDMGSWSSILYLLATIRISICFLHQNGWTKKQTPPIWNIVRNVPLFFMGLIVALMFLINQDLIIATRYAWLAITLSFVFYIPVVLWVHRDPRVGLLMLPKTLAYLWLISMSLSI